LTPDDAYPIHNIIPEQEWNALDSPLRALKSASDLSERFKCLPRVRSAWLKHHIVQVFKEGNKPRSQTLYVVYQLKSGTLLNFRRKFLIYIAALLAFRAVTGRSVPERAQIMEKMSPIPETVVDGFLTRFTENARGSTSYVLFLNEDHAYPPNFDCAF
jgi:DNA-directed RNA polymerase I subunit RPA49